MKTTVLPFCCSSPIYALVYSMVLSVTSCCVVCPDYGSKAVSTNNFKQLMMSSVGRNM
jgi:hypothetical protein